MDHYKELLEQLRNIVNHGDEQPAEYCTNRCGGCDACDKSIDAIETLLAERDAAIADIFQSSDSLCNVCKYFPDDFSPICFSCTQIGGLNNNWQWRGPQKHD